MGSTVVLKLILTFSFLNPLGITADSDSSYPKIPVTYTYEAQTVHNIRTGCRGTLFPESKETHQVFYIIDATGTMKNIEPGSPVQVIFPFTTDGEVHHPHKRQLVHFNEICFPIQCNAPICGRTVGPVTAEVVPNPMSTMMQGLSEALSKMMQGNSQNVASFLSETDVKTLAAALNPAVSPQQPSLPRPDGSTAGFEHEATSHTATFQGIQSNIESTVNDGHTYSATHTATSGAVSTPFGVAIGISAEQNQTPVKPVFQSTSTFSSAYSETGKAPQLVSEASTTHVRGDTAQLSTMSETMTGSAASETMTGSAASETMTGSAASETMTGSAATTLVAKPEVDQKRPFVVTGQTESVVPQSGVILLEPSVSRPFTTNSVSTSSSSSTTVTSETKSTLSNVATTTFSHHNEALSSGAAVQISAPKPLAVEVVTGSVGRLQQNQGGTILFDTTNEQSAQKSILSNSVTMASSTTTSGTSEIKETPSEIPSESLSLQMEGMPLEKLPASNPAAPAAIEPIEASLAIQSEPTLLQFTSDQSVSKSVALNAVSLSTSNAKVELNPSVSESSPLVGPSLQAEAISLDTDDIRAVVEPLGEIPISTLTLENQPPISQSTLEIQPTPPLVSQTASESKTETLMLENSPNVPEVNTLPLSMQTVSISSEPEHNAAVPVEAVIPTASASMSVAGTVTENKATILENPSAMPSVDVLSLEAENSHPKVLEALALQAPLVFQEDGISLDALHNQAKPQILQAPVQEPVPSPTLSSTSSGSMAYTASADVIPLLETGNPKPLHQVANNNIGFSQFTGNNIGYSHVADSNIGYSHATDNNIGFSQFTGNNIGYSHAADSNIGFSHATDSNIGFSHIAFQNGNNPAQPPSSQLGMVPVTTSTVTTFASQPAANPEAQSCPKNCACCSNPTPFTSSNVASGSLGSSPPSFISSWFSLPWMNLPRPRVPAPSIQSSSEKTTVKKDASYYASLPGAIRGSTHVIYYPSCEKDAFYQPAIVSFCSYPNSAFTYAKLTQQVM